MEIFAKVKKGIALSAGCFFIKKSHAPGPG